MPKDILIKIINLSKIYKTKNLLVKALDKVNLTIYKGEVISLLGHNGAGKTTLSSILATLHPATQGEILFRGESIYRNLTNFRKHLGFCPQNANLDLQLNVRDNLVFSGRYYLMPEKLIHERVEELLHVLNLKKYENFEIPALSGGTKQRVLIARALIHGPEIVILDEPTVGLDPDIRHQLWKIIRKLKEQGITVILTTHYLDEAEVLSDRVCFIKRGKILLTETVQDLKDKHKKEKLEDIFLSLMEEDEIVPEL
jgi:ABC-2 type transport system ATP-binding protein